MEKMTFALDKYNTFCLLYVSCINGLRVVLVLTSTCFTPDLTYYSLFVYINLKNKS